MIKKSFLWCKDNQTKLVAVLATIMTVVLCVPLFAVSHYNYPSADDFSFGSTIYHQMQIGASWIELIKAGFQEWKDYYMNWQGTYMATFLHIFEVGGKVPQLYYLTTYFLLGTFLIAGILFFYNLFHKVFCCEKCSAWFMTAVTICMQILFVPGVNESFYWFVGGAAYTFFYSLLLLGIFLICKMEASTTLVKKRLYWIAIAILLVMLGGGNYVTGLLTLELLFLFVVWKAWHKETCKLEIGLLLIYVIAFACNICAPGNTVRASAHSVMSPLESIIESILVGLNFVKIWSHGYILCYLLIILPFLLLGLSKTKYSFKKPLLFTLLTIGLFCSNLTPSIWVNGTWGGDRIVAIVYYQYFVLLLLNLAYWCGWLLQKFVQKAENKLVCELQIKKWLLPYLMFITILGAVMVILPGYYRGMNSYQAVLILKNGQAQQFAYENELRWNYLEETEETDVVIEPFSVQPPLLYHEDIVSDKEDWRNYTLASFFGKNSIVLTQEKE